MKHLLELIEQLEQRDIALISLNEQIDTTSANGRLILRLLASLAAFERDLLPNLQLLEGPENVHKRDAHPQHWAEQTFMGDAYMAYLTRNELPGLPSNAAEFLIWSDRRAQQLATRLRAMLQVRTTQPPAPQAESPATREDEFVHSLGE